MRVYATAMATSVSAHESGYIIIRRMNEPPLDGKHHTHTRRSTQVPNMVISAGVIEKPRPRMEAPAIS